ncbi:hypothetical protein BSKO_02536 [Bryopsis sp. KO-2023]|nr:hypothetical protein BSKO_02536 [Bryopsis sp. KO-2023]
MALEHRLPGVPIMLVDHTEQLRLREAQPRGREPPKAGRIAHDLAEMRRRNTDEELSDASILEEEDADSDYVLDENEDENVKKSIA